MSAPSKRVTDYRTFKNIYGTPVIFGEFSFDTHRMAGNKTCMTAARGTYRLELLIVEAAVQDSAAAHRHIRMSCVLPCCHMITLCSGCLRPYTDHATRSHKCMYGAGYGNYTLSAMDVFCPGWRDRYVGP